MINDLAARTQRAEVRVKRLDTKAEESEPENEKLRELVATTRRDMVEDRGDVHELQESDLQDELANMKEQSVCFQRVFVTG